jgi:CubicO group peptidase (beta-lactamase class C family)
MMDDILSRFVREKKLAGAVVLVAKGEEIVFSGAYGMASIEKGRPMQLDTIFRIYSFTKAITSCAALMLVEQGKLGLADPVSKYIPEAGTMHVKTKRGLVPPKREMTVKDLFLHTAGLSYAWAGGLVGKEYEQVKPSEAEDLERLGHKLGELPLAYSPGESWQYSISVDVLALVVERVSGQRFDQFLAEHIFEPLGMQDTGYFVLQSKLERFASEYERTKTGLKLLDPGDEQSRYAKPPTLHGGGSGLVSTGPDYLKFLLMIQGGGSYAGKRLLKPETVTLMTTNQLPQAAFPIRFGEELRHGTGFGLGFNVRVADTNWDRAARIGEYGWGGAASLHYWVSPHDDLIVITLEQTMPYTFDTEWALKGPIYEAFGRTPQNGAAQHHE